MENFEGMSAAEIIKAMSEDQSAKAIKVIKDFSAGHADAGQEGLASMSKEGLVMLVAALTASLDEKKEAET